LTSEAALAKIAAMQQNPRFLAAAAAALLTLQACDTQPETLEAPGIADPQAEQLSNAAPVELPPAIAASRTYRCKDNSLLYADFYTNNTANIRVGSREEMPTQLTSAGEGQPYVAEGYSLSANAAQVSLTAPGKGTQSCNA
jgi:hypothetical protein